MNIMPKHEGQAMVARRELQNWHNTASVEVAAPQFGQLSVSASIRRILAVQIKLDYKSQPMPSSRQSLENEI
jgi:hypothetical protein